MFLNVKGIGKIQDSTIEMKGITVIAGENNTGKSTFGKVLYCMFNAFFDTEKSLYSERVQDIRRIITGSLRRISINTLKRKNIDDIINSQNIRKTIEDILTINIVDEYKPDDNIIDIIIENIEKSISITDHDIQNMIINRYFRQEFAGKINHITNSDIQGQADLSIKNKKIELLFINDECQSFSDEVGLLHNAIYIDTPFIMDNIRNRIFDSISGFYDSMSHRANLMERLTKSKPNSTVVEEVIIKQKINKLLSIIHSVVDGEFKEDEDNLMFVEQVLKKPIPLLSVSAGIKSFLIIKRLLELGEIKERGVLIFDEPEIHLHPDWQIKFAEILILLQKEFNLTILLTTHSPYFLHAIEIYSKKYNSYQDCKYYLAKTKNDIADIEDVTNNVDEVFQQMALPFQKLDDIAYPDD